MMNNIKKMAKILSTKEIAPKFKQYEILAPEISKKHKIDACIIGKVTQKQDVILKKGAQEISLL